MAYNPCDNYARYYAVFVAWTRTTTQMYGIAGHSTELEPTTAAPEPNGSAEERAPFNRDINSCGWELYVVRLGSGLFFLAPFKLRARAPISCVADCGCAATFLAGPRLPMLAAASPIRRVFCPFLNFFWSGCYCYCPVLLLLLRVLRLMIKMHLQFQQ